MNLAPVEKVFLSQVKEQESILDKDTISRMNSLNPSASFYVRNRDRPSYMPMRSASMRETSYSRSIRRKGQRNNLAANNNNNGMGDTLSVGGDRINNGSNRSSTYNLTIEEDQQKE